MLFDQLRLEIVWNRLVGAPKYFDSRRRAVFTARKSIADAPPDQDRNEFAL